MRRNGQARAGLGAATLIMILLVLCLALMGVLSLMSARSDLNLSRRYAELSGEYAEASAKAQHALSSLDQQLLGAYGNAADDVQYVQACAQISEADGTTVTWESERNALMLFDAGEERRIELRVELSSWEKAHELRYTITDYRLVDMKEWGQTESLILMDM